MVKTVEPEKMFEVAWVSRRIEQCDGAEADHHKQRCPDHTGKYRSAAAGKIIETVKLEFRADATNVLNSPIFAAPNKTPPSSAFGIVTQVAWPGRQWQFAMRLRF